MEQCKLKRFGVMVLLLLLYHNCLISISYSLNHEGMALLKFKEGIADDPYSALEGWKYEMNDPCSWFGLECSDYHRVVALNLKGLCLRGTLAPELKDLVHLKSIILRDNCFNGVIPGGIGDLKELEVLDLGRNNFSGLISFDLESSLSLSFLLLDNNELLESLSPHIHHLKMISESQVDENQLSSSSKDLLCTKRSVTQNVPRTKDAVHHRRLQQQSSATASPPSAYRDPFNLIKLPPSAPRVFLPNITRSSSSIFPRKREPDMPPPTIPRAPDTSANGSVPPPPPSPTFFFNGSHTKANAILVFAGIVGGILFLLVPIIGLYVWKIKKASIKPWVTGLSGPLQNALVTGVPKLKLYELEAACEDFSNVIGSSSLGTLYKGTLSSGVEIAVAAVAAPFTGYWSKNSEAQFRNKIDTLSKVNHKNFVNLIGYCDDEKPLTRMMVFEYAPNGTLFEHLHIKESEHLNWAMRIRIMMGMAYCLEHMHQLNPPFVHKNLNSSAVYLTEDYAAKISDFSFSTDLIANHVESSRDKLLESPLASPESDVYSFGVLLIEMFTGRLPYLVHDGSTEDWAYDYLNDGQPIQENVDPTLDSVDEEKLERISEVVRSCVCPDPLRRPTMKEVSRRLKGITGIIHDAATPKLSPLWWVELELSLADASYNENRP